MPPTIPNRQWTSHLNGISNLTLTQTTTSHPATNEVLVRITAISLNYKDGETISGQFNHHAAVSLPSTIVPCSDAAGQVWEVGDGVTRWKKGDRVLALPYLEYKTGRITQEMLGSGIGSSGKGVSCEYRIFEEDALLPVPESMSDEEACTMTVAGITAWMAMNGQRPLGSPGGQEEVVLIQGTGGVSIQGLQIAKASGATVIITSSSDEKLARAKALGADYTINYKTTPDWDVEVLRLTSGRGADIIFENGGAPTTAKSFNCIRFGGLFNAIGYVSGKVDPKDEEKTNINVQAIRKNVILVGMLNGPRDRVVEMLEFYENHGIKPVIDRVFKFEEAKEALQYLWSGSHFGTVVVKVP
ncbi:quinone reductase [Mollisia scopiformis]|uniref:Quinone reductase n=1 Tax=Mollisia scopiformis TaxID=149040 RepID=A0A194XV36_MOLSC|nr:quinone reductase [Mollisia scopiformis]KUJ24001.1 quinone reductase [Mollisia scopiformis]